MPLRLKGATSQAAGCPEAIPSSIDRLEAALGCGGFSSSDEFEEQVHAGAQ